MQIWGTGGMSHQLQGPRAGLINREWDNRFLDGLVGDSDDAAPHSAHRISARNRQRGHRDGDVADHARRAGQAHTALHRHYHVPCSNTAIGHIVLTA